MKGKGRPGSKAQRYVQIVETVYKSEAFRTIPGAALKLWIDLRTQYNGGNNGRLLITPRTLASRGWNSVSKLMRARDELLSRGLILRTKYCGPNSFHKASLFAFTDVAVASNEAEGIAGMSASHDYLAWTRGTVNPVFCVVPNEVTNHSRIRSATGPESGRRSLKTVPESGQRESDREAAPTLNPQQERELAPRLPESGHTYSSTNPKGVKRATVRDSGPKLSVSRTPLLASPKPRAGPTSHKKSITSMAKR